VENFMKPVSSRLQRRNFLKLMGAVPAAEITPALGTTSEVSFLRDAGGPAASAPVNRALEKLEAALAPHGVKLNVIAELRHAKGFLIVAATPQSLLSQGFPTASMDWAAPDCLRLVPGEMGGHPALLVSAMDARGFVYGLHELAERIEFGGPVALHRKDLIEETSPNRVRSMARAFLSEIEDKAWFYDRQGWREYLDMLVAARFNRFNFALGFGYDFPKGVTGDYLHFPYPYLVEVPGHHVTITPALAAGERQKNLDTLKFIAREAGARGLDFQLGLWTHAWQWTDSPRSDHVIGGLSPGGQPDWAQGAAYSRDALAILLKECPQITGITLRVHGESGVPEGTYDFWQTLFEAIAKCGRKIEIEMHAKGINQIMIDMAVKTGQPVKVGPKYLRRASEPGLSPGRHPRAGNSLRPGAWSRACSPSPMASGDSPVTAMPIFTRKAAATAFFTGCGRGRRSICSPPIRPGRMQWDVPPISAAPMGLRSASR
jgi:hypothetical protein